MASFHKAILHCGHSHLLESRIAPANLLGPTQLAYQDRDGDNVLVTFSKPILNFGNPNAIFTFDSGPNAVNGSVTTEEQLETIDLTSIPAASIGVGIKVTATSSQLNGGDGFAAVGTINATGVDLSAVAIDGDLGRILAGDGTTSTPCLKSLAVQSLGRYGALTGSGDMHSIVQGKVGSLTVKADLCGDFEVQGDTFSTIGTVTIGGSIIGGTVVNTGVLNVFAGVGKITVGGNVEGGTADTTGVIYVGNPSLNGGGIGSVTIRGNVVGGSQTGSAELTYSGVVVGTHIKSLTIGGSLIGGTDETSGNFFAVGAISGFYDLGSVKINGSIIGNATSPAVIWAGGQQTEVKGKDLAIGSIAVKGRVEHGLILAGVNPITVYAYAPFDADAQIGPVTVGGDWIASSIAAGTVAGPTGFGTAADAKMSGQFVRDDPAISSTIVSVSIGGQAMGTASGGDHFGFVAENVGKLKIGGISVPLQIGTGDDDKVIGLTGDLNVREI